MKRVNLGLDLTPVTTDVLDLGHQDGPLLGSHPVHVAQELLAPLLNHVENVVERGRDGGLRGRGAGVELGQLGRDDGVGLVQFLYAQLRLVQENLGHALDGDGERDDGVRHRYEGAGVAGATRVRGGGGGGGGRVAGAVAVLAEDFVAGFAEQEFLERRMRMTQIRKKISFSSSTKLRTSSIAFESTLA